MQEEMEIVAEVLEIKKLLRELAGFSGTQKNSFIDEPSLQVLGHLLLIKKTFSSIISKIATKKGQNYILEGVYLYDCRCIS